MKWIFNVCPNGTSNATTNPVHCPSIKINGIVVGVGFFSGVSGGMTQNDSVVLWFAAEIWIMNTPTSEHVS